MHTFAYLQRCFDWGATTGILNGIYLTIDRHPYIAYFPNLKVSSATSNFHVHSSCSLGIGVRLHFVGPQRERVGKQP